MEHKDANTLHITEATTDPPKVILSDKNKQDSSVSPDKNSQDHLTRRPMNAFLIFCKSQRRTVQETHPELNNRAVTKMLGGMWADMTPLQKSDYLESARKVSSDNILFHHYNIMIVISTIVSYGSVELYICIY